MVVGGRGRRRSRRFAGASALGAALCVLTVTLLVGSLLQALVLVSLAGAALPLLAIELQRRLVRSVASQASLIRSYTLVLMLVAQLLVLTAVLRADRLSSPAESGLVLLVVAAQGLLGVHVALQEGDARLRPRRAELRNLPGPGALPPASPLLAARGSRVGALAQALLPLGLLWVPLTGSYAALLPAAGAAVSMESALVLAVVPGLLAVARAPRGMDLLRRVHDAVLLYRPAVLLYSAGTPADTHWVTGWLGTLEDLEMPALVLLRRPGTIDLLPATTVPVVCLAEGSDILPFRLPSAKVALYAANSEENLRLVRNPALRSAFIGHGESDKAASSNPAVKMYDEVWVAGEAGRRRYLDADIGVRPEQLRIVGRPQIRRVRPAAERPAGAPYTVLYAPTWEGLYGGSHESSLVSSGRDIVRALLAADVRVMFRPHPATGRRSAAHAAASRDIAALLARAGQRAVPAPDDLYDCFNAVDALVGDVSAVVTDFLAADKPYLVVNGAGRPDGEFREANPSTAGAYLLGPGGTGLAAALADARGADSMRQRRGEVRRLLIGPPADDPLQVFAQAILDLAATAPPASFVDSPAQGAQQAPRAAGVP